MASKTPIEKTTPHKQPTSAAKPRKAVPSKRVQKERRSREILGVVLMALGVLLWLTHISQTGIVGEKVSSFTFGLLGFVGYLMPALLIVVGIFTIAVAGKKNYTAKIVMIVLLGLCAVSILHVANLDSLIATNGYFKFLTDSFDLGEFERVGGGLFGALLAFPSSMLLGQAGSYVLFGTAALIVCIVLFNLSIKQTGERVGKAIKSNLDTVNEKITQRRADAQSERIQRRRVFDEYDEASPSKFDFAQVSLDDEKNDGEKKPQKAAKNKKRSQYDLMMDDEQPAITKPDRDTPPVVDVPQGGYEMRMAPPAPPRRPIPVAAAGADADTNNVLEFPYRSRREGRYVDFHAPEQQARPFPGASKDEEDIEAPPLARELDSGTLEDLEDNFEERIEEAFGPEPAVEDSPIAQLAKMDFGDYEKYLPPLPVRGRRESSPPPEPVERPLEDESGPQSYGQPYGDYQQPKPVPRGPVYSEPEYERPARYDESPAFAQKETNQEVNPAVIPKKAVKKPPQYIPPPISLLNPPPLKTASEDPNIKARLLEDTLLSFGISAKVTNVTQGPAITRYELQPAAGVRVNRITSLSDDIALNLAAPTVRIEAPIPGKSAVGIEIPNKSISMVTLREMLDSNEYRAQRSKVSVALGKDISGKPIYADLAKMPHLLIAGSTGSGKSVCINSIVCSIIYHAAPEDVKLIMVDPKVVELANFAVIPHLLMPVVTEAKKAANALRWATQEMIQRYNNFAKKGAKDLERYNAIITGQGEEKLPIIIVLVDELADLMMVAPDDVEDSICRIAQMGRAAGIHLVIATQRPSADIITGLIKANVPSRIAFAVASSTDSRIILDSTGADKLLGKGDMLFHPIGASQSTRVQGCLVMDMELEKIKDYFENKTGYVAEFDEELLTNMEAISAEGGSGGGGDGDDKGNDELLGKAVETLMQTGQASISMIQRRLRVGYARAARLMDEMEQMGIVSGFDGSKARRILISRAEFERIFGYAPEIPDLGT